MKNKVWLLLISVCVILAGVYFCYIRQVGISISKGDKLGAMKVVSIDPFNTEQSFKDPALMKLSSRNMTVRLQGPIIIKGTYFHPDEEKELLSGFCMKDFDKTSLEKLPQLSWIKEPFVFCFRNYHFANEKLGYTTQKVTVIIDNFILNSFPNVSNSAELVDVKL